MGNGLDLLLKTPMQRTTRDEPLDEVISELERRRSGKQAMSKEQFAKKFQMALLAPGSMEALCDDDYQRVLDKDEQALLREHLKVNLERYNRLIPLERHYQIRRSTGLVSVQTILDKIKDFFLRLARLNVLTFSALCVMGTNMRYYNPFSHNLYPHPEWKNEDGTPFIARRFGGNGAESSGNVINDGLVSMAYQNTLWLILDAAITMKRAISIGATLRFGVAIANVKKEFLNKLVASQVKFIEEDACREIYKRYNLLDRENKLMKDKLEKLSPEKKKLIEAQIIAMKNEMLKTVREKVEALINSPKTYDDINKNIDDKKTETSKKIEKLEKELKKCKEDITKCNDREKREELEKDLIILKKQHRELIAQNFYLDELKARNFLLKKGKVRLLRKSFHFAATVLRFTGRVIMTRSIWDFKTVWGFAQGTYVWMFGCLPALTAKIIRWYVSTSRQIADRKIKEIINKEVFNSNRDVTFDQSTRRFKERYINREKLLIYIGLEKQLNYFDIETIETLYKRAKKLSSDNSPSNVLSEDTLNALRSVGNKILTLEQRGLIKEVLDVIFGQGMTDIQMKAIIKDLLMKSRHKDERERYSEIPDHARVDKLYDSLVRLRRNVSEVLNELKEPNQNNELKLEFFRFNYNRKVDEIDERMTKGKHIPIYNLLNARPLRYRACRELEIFNNARGLEYFDDYCTYITAENKNFEQLFEAKKKNLSRYWKMFNVDKTPDKKREKEKKIVNIIMGHLEALSHKRFEGLQIDAKGNIDVEHATIAQLRAAERNERSLKTALDWLRMAAQGALFYNMDAESFVGEVRDAFENPDRVERTAKLNALRGKLEGQVHSTEPAEYL